MKKVYIDGESLKIEDVWDVGVNGASVHLTEEAKEKVKRCNAVIKGMVDSGEAIYGVTTGIGEFARIRVSPEFGSLLQRRIIYSHAAGVGDPFPQEEVKSAMLLRSNTLAKGYSGIRLETLQTYIDILNAGIVPVVYEKGSVGTSGDLSPLSQLAEVALGEGYAYYKGEKMPGAKALELAGIKPIVPTYKEGLALINGSQMMTAGAALLLYRIERLIKTAMIASAMTLDALKARMPAFDERVHRVRPYNGQNVVALNLRNFLKNSEIIASGSGKVQDGYSLRCTPQVLGPAVDAYFYARKQVEIEMNSAADNPLFFPDDNIHRAAGNFHGEPIAIAMDFIAIPISEIASLSERHTNRLLNPVLSGLPDFLVEGKGLNSGLMVAQYTQAVLVSENKVLAHPASVDSISVSADQEDHVSMGPVAVRKLKEIVKNTEAVLAIEMLSAAQALDFRKPLKPGIGTQIAYNEIRKVVEHLKDDRVLYPDIEAVVELVRNFTILEKVEAELGEIPLVADVEEPKAVRESRIFYEPKTVCSCGEEMEPATFKYGEIEIRGSVCKKCGQIHLSDNDMKKIIELKQTPTDRSVC